MATVLDIRKLGDPILKEVARDVEDVSCSEIQTLISDMFNTCEAASGVGIAAPQVGHPLRLFLISSRPTPTYPLAERAPMMAIINPIIISTSSEMDVGWEGCLSYPGWRGKVDRHRSVIVSFTNRAGEEEERTFEGLLARVFQHEYDHINGRMFLERSDLLYNDAAHGKLMDPEWVIHI